MPFALAVQGVDREGIMAALFARLQTVPGITTISRRWRDVSSVQANEQPALFLVDGPEAAAYNQEGAPAKWSNEPEVYLYFRNDDPATLGSTTLNTLLRDIETVTLFQAGDGFPALGAPGSLGQKVTHCRISQIRKGMGADGGQGVAIIHLHLLIAGKT